MKDDPQLHLEFDADAKVLPFPPRPQRRARRRRAGHTPLVAFPFANRADLVRGVSRRLMATPDEAERIRYWRGILADMRRELASVGIVETDNEIRQFKAACLSEMHRLQASGMRSPGGAG